MTFRLPGKQKKKEAPVPAVSFQDDKINVLLLGNSGCGKSTLVNGLLGYEAAAAGAGSAVTKQIEVYEDENLPFRMIDTAGLEYGLFRQYRIRRDLARFQEETVRKRDAKKLVHVIWYCIDGTAKRVDLNAMDYIRSVTAAWPGVPVILVITKSYSDAEREENRRVAAEAVETYNRKHPRSRLNVQDIICVVAKEYVISDTVCIPPRGLDTLLVRTNELAPKARQLADASIRNVDRKLRQNRANAAIRTAAAAAAAVGAIPIHVPDSTVLVPIQLKMLKEVALVYEQQDDNATRSVTKYVMQAGATTIAGKALVKALKQVPGLNLAAALIDALAAGAVTYVTGMTAEIVFERFYTGEWDRYTPEMDAEVKQIFHDLLPDVTEALKKFLSTSRETISSADIAGFFQGLLTGGR